MESVSRQGATPLHPLYTAVIPRPQKATQVDERPSVGTDYHQRVDSL